MHLTARRIQLPGSTAVPVPGKMRIVDSSDDKAPPRRSGPTTIFQRIPGLQTFPGSSPSLQPTEELQKSQFVAIALPPNLLEKVDLASGDGQPEHPAT
jgi:hypothetical protein